MCDKIVKNEGQLDSVSLLASCWNLAWNNTFPKCLVSYHIYIHFMTSLEKSNWIDWSAYSYLVWYTEIGSLAIHRTVCQTQLDWQHQPQRYYSWKMLGMTQRCRKIAVIGGAECWYADIHASRTINILDTHVPLRLLCRAPALEALAMWGKLWVKPWIFSLQQAISEY